MIKIAQVNPISAPQTKRNCSIFKITSQVLIKYLRQQVCPFLFVERKRCNARIMCGETRTKLTDT